MKSEEALAEVTGNLDSVPLPLVSSTSPTPSPFDHVFAHLNWNRMDQWQKGSGTTLPPYRWRGMKMASCTSGEELSQLAAPRRRVRLPGLVFRLMSSRHPTRNYRLVTCATPKVTTPMTVEGTDRLLTWWCWARKVKVRLTRRCPDKGWTDYIGRIDQGSLLASLGPAVS